MTVCTQRPANNTQLDDGEPTRGYDCGVCKTQDAIDFASCGKVRVSISKLRELMGKPGKQSTDPRDWKSAIESDYVAEKFRAKGLRAPRALLRDGVDVAIAREDLREGRFLIGAGWYGTLRARAPRKAASAEFSDNHAFGIFGVFAGERTNENDPLADGRPDGSGGHYPEGTQRIKWSVLRDVFGDVRLRTRDASGRILTERKLGRGLFLGIAVPRAKPLVDDGSGDPDPLPVPTHIDWRAELTALEADLGDALDAAESARRDVDTVAETISAIRRHVVDLEHEIGEGS